MFWGFLLEFGGHDPTGIQKQPYAATGTTIRVTAGSWIRSSRLSTVPRFISAPKLHDGVQEKQPSHKKETLLEDKGLLHLLKRCSEVTTNDVERRVDFGGKSLHSSHRTEGN